MPAEVKTARIFWMTGRFFCLPDLAVLFSQVQMITEVNGQFKGSPGGCER
jgi:hypothetical protein